jgi:hypothetical protein
MSFMRTVVTASDAAINAMLAAVICFLSLIDFLLPSELHSSCHRHQQRQQQSAYSAAPTLRSNATTSHSLLSMAYLRGVSPPLQAGG